MPRRKIRHYGLIANTGRKKNLSKARALLKVKAPIELSGEETTTKTKQHEALPTFVCPCCGSAMLVIEILPHMYLPRAPPLGLNK